MVFAGASSFRQVSTHSRLKAAGFLSNESQPFKIVSTHSRLKAAGSTQPDNRTMVESFNTQPPEGGWFFFVALIHLIAHVSTHSRLKAAGAPAVGNGISNIVSTHSRLKAAGSHRNQR